MHLSDLRCRLNVCLVELASFEALRGIITTGAVITPPVFKWAAKAFGPDIHLISTSGGTDVCTACRLYTLILGTNIEWRTVVTGATNLPVHVGGLLSISPDFRLWAKWFVSSEIQAKSLGMKVEVFDPSGNNIEHTGLPGELVCTRPHPSIPIRFWGDTPDHKKLRETYFSTYPGLWKTVQLGYLSLTWKERYLAARRLHGR